MPYVGILSVRVIFPLLNDAAFSRYLTLKLLLNVMHFKNRESSFRDNSPGFFLLGTTYLPEKV